VNFRLRNSQIEEMENPENSSRIEGDIVTTIHDLGLSNDELDLVKGLLPNAEDEPILFLLWNRENLVSFICKIQYYRGSLNPHFQVPEPLDTYSLSMAIVDHWKSRVPDAPPTIRHICLPGTLVQFSHYIRLKAIESCDPWYNAVDAISSPSSFPLAEVFLARPSSSLGLLDRLKAFNPSAPF
jgi:hypothetical protein